MAEATMQELFRWKGDEGELIVYEHDGKVVIVVTDSVCSSWVTLEKDVLTAFVKTLVKVT